MQAQFTTECHALYIVISQTGTFLSRVLKAVTGAPYNHVSVSLDQKLIAMYSFGRIHPYNPLWAGFIMESPRTGTFKRFAQTEAVILRVPISEEQYRGIAAFLEEMYRHREIYHYNFAGLALAAFHIRWSSRYRYYCSEFVKELLVRFQVADAGQFHEITQPIEFMALGNASIIYRGKLRLYS